MKIITFLLLILAFSGTVYAQVTEDHPLSGTNIIQNGGGDEIFNLSGSNVSVFKYYKAMEKYSVDTLVKTASYQLESSWARPDMDLADVDNDGMSEILASWTWDQKAEITMLKVDPAKLTIDPENAWSHVVSVTKSSPAVYQSPEWMVSSLVMIKGGNLDSDPEQEFVIAYWAEDQMIQIYAFNVDKDYNITEIGSIRDQIISASGNINLCEDDMFIFDIECADLNGDGIDEILLSGRKDKDPSGYEIFANLYSYNEGLGKLEAKLKNIVFEQTNPDFDIANFNLESGNFHSRDMKTAVIGIYEFEKEVYGNAASKTFVSNILIPVKINPDLDEMTTGTHIYQRNDSIPNDCYYQRISTLQAEDFNNDGLDELVSAYAYEYQLPTLKIYTGNVPLGFSLFADLDKVAENFSGSITVGNIYKDTGMVKPKELLINVNKEGSWGHASNLYQLNLQSNGSFKDIVLLKENCSQYLDLGKTGILLTGNIDNDIRIGKPKRHSVTDILQPLVILNAPPIHFDVFDGECYDVCRSYNENQSVFNARYVKENQQSTEVTTEFNRDRSSGSASGGLSYWGVTVSASLAQTYGEKFSKVDGTARTVTVGVAIDATVDDQIYATVMEYDIWEYPVYANDLIQDHVLVVEPKIVKNAWFDSKSWKGYSYIPNHEVGNILSYRRYPMLSDNPLMTEKIKGDYGLETSFLISGNSSYDWFLSFSDFTESQATTTKEFSRDWGVSVSGWGCGFSLDGSYNKENIETQRTTIENNIDLDVHLGS